MIVYEIKSAGPALKERLLSLIDGASNARKTGVPWPLPNTFEVTDTDFWGHVTTWTPAAHIWGGQAKIDGAWANIIVYLVDHGTLAGGGFAVLRSRAQAGREGMRYFRWTLCAHEFDERTTGNCERTYTCKRCRASYVVDSSD